LEIDSDEEKDENLDESSEDEDAINDDFIDWPIDFRLEILKAKKQSNLTKTSNYYWSG